ncbi:hypothetical protein K438DRAFT_1781917 [Mycena galopus ATCC 62051]|nr:hypothetical protein K438DRAFT_1781917 [Mycena galopus ATCC 62051]
MGGAVRSSLEAALGLLRCTAVSRSSFIGPFGRPGLKSDITTAWRKKADGKDAEEGEDEELRDPSGDHAVRALEHPRWKDYTYEHLDGHTNRFFWAGNGMTVAEENPDADIPQRS